MSEILAEVIAAKAEKQFGQKPTHSQVLDFLRTLNGTPSNQVREDMAPQLKSTSTKPASIDLRRPLKSTSSKLRMESTPRTKKVSKEFYEAQKHLDVKMPNGEHIRHENGIDTFRQVISKLGVERCEPYDPYIVKHRRELPESVRKPILIDGYYVECGGPTKQRKERLEHIARGLRIQITVTTPRK